MDAHTNIVWINLESVRYDHTSVGGYHRDTTPNLARIAAMEGGTSLDYCFSHSNWTAPSCSSIFTGTYPGRHGVGVGPNETVPESLATAPELFRDVGYYTAGLTGNGYSGPVSGLDRGFDRYTFFRGDNVHRKLGLRTTLKYVLNLQTHGGGFTPRTVLHGTSYMMNDVLKRWVRSFRGVHEPFFLWAHYGDPHHPYTPPLSFLRRFTDDIAMDAEDAREFAITVHENLYEYIANGCAFSDDEWDALEAMYDAEIAYTDECVGRLFDYVQSSTVGETVFVVTADHGELFGEKDLISHKLVLDDALTHVPMVVYGLDGIEHQADELVQHADVMKTLLAAVGGETDQFQGIDLRNEVREFVVSQHGGKQARYEEYNPDFDWSRFHTSLLTSLRTSSFRYQKSAERSELYRLPDEGTDVSRQYPDVTAELDEMFDDWVTVNGQFVRSEQRAELNEDMQRHLSDMGYLA